MRTVQNAMARALANPASVLSFARAAALSYSGDAALKVQLAELFSSALQERRGHETVTSKSKLLTDEVLIQWLLRYSATQKQLVGVPRAVSETGDLLHYVRNNVSKLLFFQYLVGEGTPAVEKGLLAAAEATVPGAVRSVTFTERPAGKPGREATYTARFHLATDGQDGERRAVQFLVRCKDSRSPLGKLRVCDKQGRHFTGAAHVRLPGTGPSRDTTVHPDSVLRAAVQYYPPPGAEPGAPSPDVATCLSVALRDAFAATRPKI